MTVPTAREDRLARPGVLIGACVVVYLPFVLLGYGTDVDVANVLRAGRGWLDGEPYSMSRRPGASIHEVATAALDVLGGSVLVNLASVAFAALALWAVYDLLRREGSAVAPLAVLVLASNPWFWIAATSLGDFVWALGLALAGVAAARRDHRVLAAVLFGASIGCRLSTVLLVVAWLVAERTGPRSARVPWRATFVVAGVTLVLGGLAFYPSWNQFDRTFEFLDSEVPFEGLRVHLGRWGVKNLAFFGVLGGAVLVAGIPRLLHAARGWRSSVTLRFALVAVAAVELLYLRYPFKPLHLLPAAAALALIVGHLRRDASRWIAVLVIAQLIGGIVGTTIAAPDVPDRATTGDIQLGITAGPLLTDVRCRLDDRADGPYVEAGDAETLVRVHRNANCQIETWRAG